MRERAFRLWEALDRVLLFSILLLAIIGVVFVRSATYGVDGSNLFVRQVLWMLVALLVLLVFLLIDYHTLAFDIFRGRVDW